MGGFLYYEVIEILQPLLLRGDVVGIDHVLLWSTFTATSVFAVKRMFVPAVLRLTVGLNGTAAQNRRSHGFERMAPQPGATKL